MLTDLLAAPRAIALTVFVLAAMAVAGCGGSSDDESTSTTASTTSTTSNATTTTGAQNGGGTTAKPVAAPKPTESVTDAEKRIAKAFDSGDCDQIIELAPIARRPTGAAAQTRCEQLKSRFADAKATDTEAFGKGGGVIDYAGTSVFSAVLVVDEDGLYRIALIDPFLHEKSVGTKLAPQFKQAADDAVKALSDHDCDALLAAANRRLGPGAFDQSALCDFADNNPVAAVLQAVPDVKLDEIGGNADYALYGLGGPGAYYVILMARESDKNLPQGGEPLPKDAPEYGFAGVVPTNTRDASN
jgi:hypothetical protein